MKQQFHLRPSKKLIPPPASLISDKIKKHEPVKEAEGDVLPKPVDEKPVEKPEKKAPRAKKKEEKEENPPEGESSETSRMATEEQDALSTSTSFALSPQKDSFFGKFW